MNAEELMKSNIEAMQVPVVDRELETLARDAAGFIPACQICPMKHPQEILFKEEVRGHVKTRDSVMLIPNGVLTVQKTKIANDIMAVGSVKRATVANLAEAGFQIRDVVHGIYLFIEQEKMLRMCGGVKPALA